MELYWRQTQFAWIASLPEFADDRGHPVVEPPDKIVKDLCKYLLAIGGMRVCVFFTEAVTCPLFLSEGQLVIFKGLLLKPGDSGNCHTDTVSQWRTHSNQYRIMTGYGLSEDDGMWRRHSWLITKDDTILETTVERTKYFGIILSDSQVQSFAQTYTDL